MLLGFLPSSLAGTPRAPIVSMTPKEWEKLDTFESHTLSQAEKLYRAGKWRQAISEYDAFVQDFARSKCIPYVLVKKGLCRMYDNKLYHAVKEFDEVLDYFPNNINCAAPALYRIGECHWQMGNIEKAMKAWAEMANDKDYSKHHLAAFAVNALADNLMKQAKPQEAVKYYEQVALDFKGKNRDAVGHAAGPVVLYYIKTSPNEKKLRPFWDAIWGDAKTKGSDAEERRYWSTVLQHVHNNSNFEDTQKGLQQKYLSYWCGTFRGKFPEWDDYQISLANLQHELDKDAFRRVNSLDAQFRKSWKAGDAARVLKWLRLFGRNKVKLKQYCDLLARTKLDTSQLGTLVTILQHAGARDLAKDVFTRHWSMLDVAKLDLGQIGGLAYALQKAGAPELAREAFNTYYNTLSFGKLTNAQIRHLISIIYDTIHDKPRGSNTIRKLHFEKMPDNEILGLAHWLWKRDPDMVEEVTMRVKDKEAGKMSMLRFYVYSRNTASALPLSLEMTRADRFAKEAWGIRAELLVSIKEYRQAIGAFRMVDNPPANLWRIADCYVALKDITPAIAQLQEIESFFQQDATRAAMRIATVYQGAGQQKKYIGALRRILKKYPKTGESSTAHQLLERLGVKMGGGVEAE